MRGTLAYKDIHGRVWNLVEIEDEVMAYSLGVPDNVREDTFENVISEIDNLDPEWLKEQTAIPLQTEQADTVAFPELATNITLGDD